MIIVEAHGRASLNIKQKGCCTATAFYFAFRIYNFELHFRFLQSFCVFSDDKLVYDSLNVSANDRCQVV